MRFWLGMLGVAAALFSLGTTRAVRGHDSLPVREQRAVAGAAQSDDATSAAVDAYVEKQMKAQETPGLALAVVRDGQLIKAQGYGLANIELDVRVKPETIFQTGSVGKQFTSAAVMMLVEEGKIGLDDRISKYLPGTPAKWARVTVRNLLTHTSGIADYAAEANPKPGGVIDLHKGYTEEQLFQRFATLPMDFNPGEKWSYSNTGYVLLGIIIHKVTGEFYGDFLQERIFRPLGMTATRIISEADIIPNRAAGYEIVDGKIQNQKWVSPTLNTTADGALYTNVLDMAKWDEALYAGKLLKKSSYDLMWTPVTLAGGKNYGYGFGWDITEANGHRLIEHGGAWQGFRTQISRYVDDRLTVIVLANLDEASPEETAHGVAAIYVPGVSPTAAKAIEDREPEVTALVQRTLADLAAGKVNLESFSASEREKWTPARTAGFSEMVKELGTLQTLKLIGREQEGKLRALNYVATFSQSVVMVTLWIDADGKIDALRVHK